MIAQVSESKLGQVARTSHLMTSGTGFTAYLGMYKFLCDCQCLEHHFQGNDYAHTTHLVAFADRQQGFPAEISNSFLTKTSTWISYLLKSDFIIERYKDENQYIVPNLATPRKYSQRERP